MYRWAIAALWVGLLIGSGRGEDWPQYRGPRGDGTWRAPPLPEQWPAAGLQVRWKHPIGGGYAGISVVGSRVYTLDRQTEPTERERLLCLDAQSGEVVWEHAWDVSYGDLDYGNGPRAQPTVADGRVYAVGAVGDVRCVDAATGRLIWAKHYTRDFGGRLPTWGYAGAPVLHGGRLLLAPGGPAAGLVALVPETGQEIWRSLADEAGYSTPVVVEESEGTRVIHWTPSHLRCVDFADGRLLWSHPHKVTYGVSIAKPLVQDGLVVFSGYWEGSQALRLNPADGESRLAWEDARWLRGLMSPALSRGGHAYLLDKQYGLTCLEVATGKKLWDDGNQMTPRGRNPHASLVWLGQEDRVLILNAEGELILARLDPTGYRETSRTKLLGHTWAHPAFAGTGVYARSDTEIVCVDLPTP